MAMLTEARGDRNAVPPMADLSAASSLARLPWLNVTVPLNVTALAVDVGVLLAPLALLEHAAVNVTSAIADRAATERRVGRVIALLPFSCEGCCRILTCDVAVC